MATMVVVAATTIPAASSNGHPATSVATIVAAASIANVRVRVTAPNATTAMTVASARSAAINNSTAPA